MRSVIWLVVASACTNYSAGTEPEPEPQPELREHDPRFVGAWVVAQPFHALYEQTIYRFDADGALVTGASVPDDCSGHLSQHCVTGSVASCVPPMGQSCTSELTCVFGAEWYSLSSSTLVIVGDCSDGKARPIRLEFNADASTNTEGGANATLTAVDGNPSWSHDNWDWAFQKCTGDESTCPDAF